MPQLKSAPRGANISPGALKLKEACQYLGGLSVPTMHRLIRRGLLRPNRALRHLIFPVAELDRFLREGMNE
jgi:helix-turn-helix protein